MSSPNTISASEAATKIRDEKACLLDVRTPAEFDAMHVSGALLKPLDQLDPEGLRSAVEDGAELLIMCKSGKRAELACAKLGGEFPSAKVIKGGIEGWAAAGLAVEKGRGVISLERQVRIAAGLLVLLGSILAWQVNLAFLAIPAFVGAGLTFAGITDTCGMAMLLAKMPSDLEQAHNLN